MGLLLPKYSQLQFLFSVCSKKWQNKLKVSVKTLSAWMKVLRWHGRLSQVKITFSLVTSGIKRLEKMRKNFRCVRLPLSTSTNSK